LGLCARGQPAEDVRRIGYRPAEAWRLARSASREARPPENFRDVDAVLQSFCVMRLIPCRFLLGSPCHEPRGALRAQNRLSEETRFSGFARTDAC
jgi:hypothetical protein